MKTKKVSPPPDEIIFLFEEYPELYESLVDTLLQKEASRAMALFSSKAGWNREGGGR